MKLGKNGSSLFPRKLTRTWPSFLDDYPRIHEAAHEAMRCPWNTSPKTIDDFIEVCNLRDKWKNDNPTKPIPGLWSCMITHEMFEDIIKTIKELRDEKRNT